MTTPDRPILAVDPGSSKCGLALADRTGKLLWRGIARNGELAECIDQARAVGEFGMIIVGSGTSSKQTVEEIRAHLPSVGILIVDETGTTLRARELYWKHIPRKGWRRLLPASMQVPPDPVDDFAALALVERVLRDAEPSQ